MLLLILNITRTSMNVLVWKYVLEWKSNYFVGLSVLSSSQNLYKKFSELYSHFNQNINSCCLKAGYIKHGYSYCNNKKCLKIHIYSYFWLFLLLPYLMEGVYAFMKTALKLNFRVKILILHTANVLLTG